ncbi:hypothetical protein ABL78_5171 [Leptomonas seymouri]|uniref:Uncharacterized protein n=1 Tax=Leptomonas seymouri TaxID=5684 RepID=A0A0N1PCP2_LEPSE|nr:hypothetical protein ABL78_5171 [Leptomonas seymouri]|eukprot:KPI85780.1 hypothetical protein ABL78_5171 [Leptomonas seymouri]
MVRRTQAENEEFRAAVAALEAEQAKELAAVQQREMEAASSLQKLFEGQMALLTRNLATLEEQTAAIRTSLKEPVKGSRTLESLLSDLNAFFGEVDVAGVAMDAIDEAAQSLKKAVNIAQSSQDDSHADSTIVVSYKGRRHALELSHSSAIAQLDEHLLRLDKRIEEFKQKFGFVENAEAKEESSKAEVPVPIATSSPSAPAAASSSGSHDTDVTPSEPSTVDVPGRISTRPADAAATSPSSYAVPERIAELHTADLRYDPSVNQLIETLVRQAEERGYNISKYEMHHLESQAFFVVKGRVQVIGATVLVTLISVIQTARWCLGGHNDVREEAGAANMMKPAPQPAVTTAGAAARSTASNALSSAPSQQGGPPTSAGLPAPQNRTLPPSHLPSADRGGSFENAQPRQRYTPGSASLPLTGNPGPTQQLASSSTSISHSSAFRTDSQHTQLPLPTGKPQCYAPAPASALSSQADSQGVSPHLISDPPAGPLPGGVTLSTAAPLVMGVPPPPLRRRRDAEDFELQNPFLSRWS